MSVRADSTFSTERHAVDLAHERLAGEPLAALP
jgi:hypothetical protein